MDWLVEFSLLAPHGTFYLLTLLLSLFLGFGLVMFYRNYGASVLVAFNRARGL